MTRFKDEGVAFRGYLECGACGHVVPDVSWEHHPGIETMTHLNELLPVCPKCGYYAEFSETEG